MKWRAAAGQDARAGGLKKKVDSLQRVTLLLSGAIYDIIISHTRIASHIRYVFRISENLISFQFKSSPIK